MFNILLFVQLLTLVLAGEDISHPAAPDVSRHKNIELLPKVCGNTTVSSRIWDGQKTGIFEFPWMAYLLVSLDDGVKFLCGGTIINERYILTAAHCLPDLHSVRVGEHNANTDENCQDTKAGVVCAPPFQDLEVEKIIPHENYDPNSYENDIGLVRVSRIDLTQENSKPVCLPLAEARTYNFGKEESVVAGWGLTKNGDIGKELLKESVPYVTLDICQKKWKRVSEKWSESIIYVDHRQICAGGAVNKKDACRGDSGGPLLVNGTIDGHKAVVQQGIVSFGDPHCIGLDVPVVYTKVAMFMDWILDKLEP